MQVSAIKSIDYPVCYFLFGTCDGRYFSLKKNRLHLRVSRVSMQCELMHILQVADCEQQLDFLLNHLKICDEKYLEMHREREKLRTRVDEMR